MMALWQQAHYDQRVCQVRSLVTPAAIAHNQDIHAVGGAHVASLGAQRSLGGDGGTKSQHLLGCIRAKAYNHKGKEEGRQATYRAAWPAPGRTLVRPEVGARLPRLLEWVPLYTRGRSGSRLSNITLLSGWDRAALWISRRYGGLLGLRRLLRLLLWRIPIGLPGWILKAADYQFALLIPAGLPCRRQRLCWIIFIYRIIIEH